MRLFYLVSIFLFLSRFTYSQNSNITAIPDVEIKTLEGKTVSSSVISNNQKPIYLIFWATWCKPCLQELTAISEVYEEWQRTTGVKVVAIAVDDSRSTNQVAPLVKSKEFPFEVYLDPNGNLKRSMQVIYTPHTFLINGEGKIVSQHTSYKPGDEEKVFELLKGMSLTAPKE